jgi:hypothetical protein
VPTRCRHRGGIVDPLGCKACRAIRQPISPSTQIQDHSIQNHPKPVSFLSSGVSSESSLTPLNPYYHSYTVATSGVHRLASQIFHNRLFRKKLQQNILRMVSTEVSSLAAHNIRRVQMELKARHHFTTENCPWSNGTIESACKQVIRAFRAVLSELKMCTDEWPEVANIVQSVLNNSLSTRLNKRTPMQVFTGHAEDYTACADVEGQRACQRAS